MVESLDTNLDNITYAAVASELIQELFASYDVDRNVFNTVVNYSKSIRQRNVRLGTIILGWQMLSLAGIMPQHEAFNTGDGIDLFWNELRIHTHMNPSLSLRNAMPNILAYQWGNVAPIELPGTVWKELERLLFSYCEQEIGKQLQSVKFLMSL